jgi:uncharacterized membrane protein YqjE
MSGNRILRDATTPELLGALVRETAELVRTEVALARAEVKADIQRELRAAIGIGIAAVCALVVLTLVLVAIALAIADATRLTEWAAVLLIALPVFTIGVVAGVIGFSRRVRAPLVRTQRTLKENVRWAKERLA